jgi:hypothetical protein
VQKAVTVIPNEVWDAGPAAMAAPIDLIVQAALLRAEAAAIREKLNALLVNLDSLGRFTHNGPPDADESPLVLRARLKGIQSALLDIESELVEPEPDVEKLISLADRLKGLWDKLSIHAKIAVGALVITVSSGFFGAMGEDAYVALKANLPSLAERVSAFATRFEAPVSPSVGPR